MENSPQNIRGYTTIFTVYTRYEVEWRDGRKWKRFRRVSIRLHSWSQAPRRGGMAMQCHSLAARQAGGRLDGGVKFHSADVQLDKRSCHQPRSPTAGSTAAAAAAAALRPRFYDRHAGHRINDLLTYWRGGGRANRRSQQQRDDHCSSVSDE